MIVTAALSWWNEPTWALDRMVRSLHGVVDRLVAVDGRWQLMPGRSRMSSLEEAETIEAAAAAVGIDLDLDVATGRRRRWTQIEKRDFLMRRATRGSDWVLIVDGDIHVTFCDRAGLEHTLACTDFDVAEIEVTNVGEGIRSRWPRHRRLLYRASAGVRVVTAHNGYRASDGRWLNGDPAHVTVEPAANATAHLRYLHDIDSRGRERRGQQRDYYAARAGAGEEAWAV